MVCGVPCMCMAQHAGAVSTATDSIGIAFQGGYIVDDLRAQPPRPAGHQRLGRVDRDGTLTRSHSAWTTGNTGAIPRRRRPAGRRPGALAADVQQVGALVASRNPWSMAAADRGTGRHPRNCRA